VKFISHHKIIISSTSDTKMLTEGQISSWRALLAWHHGESSVMY